ncbi:hypothetical protein LTR53_008045 [Teratosphaeriaceae sp. CCFEE 6253]|nr:hypothetical protein LTR53_008045 [Teratosphaeriaceae sp. CCFEE 6253]
MIIATNLYTFAIYNSSAHQWDCCGEGGCNGTVTGETFSAIAPSQWSAVPTTATNSANVAATVSVPSPSSASTSTTTSVASSTTPVSTATTTPTSSPQPATKGTSLSTGAKAGIAIAIVVVVLAVIAAAVFLTLRKRRRAAVANDQSGLPAYDDAMGAHHTAAAKYAHIETSELDSRGVFRSELEARSPAQELSAEGPEPKKV